jgi:hypothetical protein
MGCNTDILLQYLWLQPDKRVKGRGRGGEEATQAPAWDHLIRNCPVSNLLSIVDPFRLPWLDMTGIKPGKFLTFWGPGICFLCTQSFIILCCCNFFYMCRDEFERAKEKSIDSMFLTGEVVPGPKSCTPWQSYRWQKAQGGEIHPEHQMESIKIPSLILTISLPSCQEFFSKRREINKFFWVIVVECNYQYSSCGGWGEVIFRTIRSIQRVHGSSARGTGKTTSLFSKHDSWK